jgi:hypothetical protein
LHLAEGVAQADLEAPYLKRPALGGELIGTLSDCIEVQSDFRHLVDDAGHRHRDGTSQ